MIKAISAGFSGSLAVVHAETVEDCFRRMLTMMLESGIRLDTAELQRLIAKAIDLIVHAELFMDGCRRVTALSEIAYDEERERVVIRELFSYKQTGMDEAGRLEGHWEMNPERPEFMEKFAKRRVELPPGFFRG